MTTDLIILITAVVDVVAVKIIQKDVLFELLLRVAFLLTASWIILVISIASENWSAPFAVAVTDIVEEIILLKEFSATLILPDMSLEQIKSTFKQIFKQSIR